MSQEPSQENRPNLDRAAKLLRKPDATMARPRHAATDSFEQNPLIREGELYQGSQDRVREAVRRVVEDHDSVTTVARELGLAPASVQRWKKQYYQLLAEEEAAQTEAASAFQELNDAAGVEDRRLGSYERERFADNWGHLMEISHATESDFKQDPWDVWLQTSDWTGWLYNEDGRLERSSLLGFLFLVLTVVAAYLMLMVDKASILDAKAEPAQKPGAALLLRDELNLDKSYEVVRLFLREDNWIKRLQYIRDRDRVAPLIQDYYTKNPDVGYRDVIPYAGMPVEDLTSVSVEIPDLDQIHYFNIVNAPTSQSARSHLIDWESSTMFQRPNYRYFVQNQPRKPWKLWVKLKKGEYYNRQFSDSKVYNCYSMSFPGLPESLFGYAKADSPEGTTLRISMLRGEEPGMIIEARYPEKILDPIMVEITSVVSEKWVPDTDK